MNGTDLRNLVIPTILTTLLASSVAYFAVYSRLLLLLFPLSLSALVIIIQPTIGLYLLLFSLPFEHMLILDGTVTIVRLVGIGVFGLWIVGMVVEASNLEVSSDQVRRTLVFVLLFIGWAFLSGLWAADRTAWLSSTQSYISFSMLLILMVGLIRDTSVLRTSFQWLCVAAFVIALIPTVRFLSGSFALRSLFYEGFEFGLANPNQYGSFLMALVPFCLLLAHTDRSKWRHFWLVAALILSTGVAFSLSRAASLGLIMSLLVHYLLHRRNLSHLVIVIVVFSMVLLFLVSDPKIAARYMGVLDLSTNNVRLEIWHRAKLAFYESPLVGAGSGNFQSAILPFSSSLGLLSTGRVSQAPHNLFASLGVELGTIGLCLFTVVIIKSFQLSRFVMKVRGASFIANSAKSSFASMIGLLTYGMFHDIDTAKIFWLVIGFTLSAALILHRKGYSAVGSLKAANIEHS